MNDNLVPNKQNNQLCATLSEFNGGATDQQLQRSYSNLLSVYQWVQREISLGTTDIEPLLYASNNTYLTKRHRTTYLSVLDSLNIPSEQLRDLPCLLQVLQCAMNRMSQQLLIIPRNAAEIFYLWVFDHLHNAFMGWFDVNDIAPISRKYINVNIDQLIANLRSDQVDQLEGFINYITHNPSTRTRENGIWGFAPFAKKLKMAVINDPQLAARIRAQCIAELAKTFSES